ncbi:MAG: hypothetical protein R2766_13645 [Saprospiraceae bacterium]
MISGMGGFSGIIGSGIGLTTYRVHDPALGRWYQVDPYAEGFYSMSPYCSMANNPIIYTDAEGGFIIQAIGGVVGGVLNVVNNLDKIIANPVSAIGYAVTGIGAGVVATLPGGVAASRAILASGNVITDVVSGNIPSFDSLGDMASYAGGTALDAFTTAGSAKAISQIAKSSLKNAALKASKEVAEEGVAIGLGSLGESSLNANISPIDTPLASELFWTATEGTLDFSAQSTDWTARAASNLGVNAVSAGLGISIDPSNQVDRSLLNKPNKLGNAPTLSLMELRLRFIIKELKSAL